MKSLSTQRCLVFIFLRILLKQILQAFLLRVNIYLFNFIPVTFINYHTVLLHALQHTCGISLSMTCTRLIYEVEVSQTIYPCTITFTDQHAQGIINCWPPGVSDRLLDDQSGPPSINTCGKAYICTQKLFIFAKKVQWGIKQSKAYIGDLFSPQDIDV